jgi:predicted acylesterase/phospholipase RssA
MIATAAFPECQTTLPLRRLGLALSGGGFRASLYHLGLIRFLRDAGILSRVSHITSVSGGSIIAAHLVLNWDRYNGSPNEFDAAAAEFLAFVNLDVRNRIARRFPLTALLRWPRRLLGLSNRKLTRTGLLEQHYERYLYGDTSLFQLPDTPRLHILATNLSEGCLCSFNRDGLLMIRRHGGHAFRLDRVHVGLATVAMAVTASSAFPGFFPPIELTGADVGACCGEFGRQAYTDGGVFDNLGVRMFGCLNRFLLTDTPLTRDDFLDYHDVLNTLREVASSGGETPLHRLARVVGAVRRTADLPAPPGPAASGTAPPAVSVAGGGEGDEWLSDGLWDVLRHRHLHREPLFAHLKLADRDAEALHRASRHTHRDLDPGDQLWLNRHLVEAAFRQATGRPCFRKLNSALDGVLVSDVGKRIEVQANRPAGGLIRTTLRATDILMDRVWQLEVDTFLDTPDFVFAPISDVVEPSEDPTAPHPEIQRQLARVRTDLDRFSPLEVSSLVRHGFCGARKACRGCPEMFGAELPGNAPWDPTSVPSAAAPAALPAPGPAGRTASPSRETAEARALQESAFRRIWGAFLDYRDWCSYVYVPLIVPILVLTPYFVVQSYQRSHRINRIIESLSQGSRQLEVMTRLLEKGPEKPWAGEPAEEVDRFDEPDFTGFEVVQDTRIVDLRQWNPAQSGKDDGGSLVRVYRRVKVLRRRETPGNNFRMGVLATSPRTEVRFPRQELTPSLRKSSGGSSAPGQNGRRWEAAFDFQKVAPGDAVELFADYHSPGRFLERGANSCALVCETEGEPQELALWILMPRGREYQAWHLTRHKAGKPETVDGVKPVTEYLADDFTILAFKLLALKPGYVYEVSWHYK